MSNTLPSLELNCSVCGLLQDQHSLVRRNWKMVCRDTHSCQVRLQQSTTVAVKETSISPTIPHKEGILITSVLSGTRLHQDCHKALLTMSNFYGFELIVLPVKWGTNDEQLNYDLISTDYYTEFSLDNRDYLISDNLNINANAATPLSGLAGISGNRHLVLPHPVRHLETTASPVGEQSKLLVTTGTISDFDSKHVTSRVSSSTKFHSQLGCTVLTDGDYPITPLSYCRKSKSFEYEGLKFSSDGSVSYVENTEYCYLADMHLAHPRPEYVDSLIGELETYKVRNAVGGDMFDGSSLLHHESKRLGYFANRMTIFEELDLLKTFATRVKLAIKGDLRAIIGNHETFGDRFFDSNSFLTQLQAFTKVEQVFLLKGLAWTVENSKKTTRGIEYKSLFEYFLQEHTAGLLLKLASQIKFHDILLGFHGNEYLLSKAGVRNANYKVVSGHVHAPAICRNKIDVGYGGNTRPTYQSGLSKAEAAHAMVSDSGRITLRVYLPN